MKSHFLLIGISQAPCLPCDWVTYTAQQQALLSCYSVASHARFCCPFNETQPTSQVNPETMSEKMQQICAIPCPGVAARFCWPGQTSHSLVANASKNPLTCNGEGL